MTAPETDTAQMDAAEPVRVRCFAALELDEPARALLGGWAGRLADGKEQVLRPLAPSTLHLTFAYLGDVPETMVPEVALALAVEAASVPGPIGCTVDGVAVMGPTRGALVATTSIDLLAPLSAARDRFLRVAELSGARSLDLRPWRPHVTVARSVGRADLGAVLDPSVLEVPAAAWVASGVALVASIPGPTGERHHRLLRSMPFAGRAAVGRR